MCKVKVHKTFRLVCGGFISCEWTIKPQKKKLLQAATCRINRRFPRGSKSKINRSEELNEYEAVIYLFIKFPTCKLNAIDRQTANDERENVRFAFNVLICSQSCSEEDVLYFFSGVYLQSFIKPSVLKDFGRSNGRPIPRLQMNCDRQPRARETPKRTV